MSTILLQMMMMMMMQRWAKGKETNKCQNRLKDGRM
jgi:hypothetical protein